MGYRREYGTSETGRWQRISPKTLAGGDFERTAAYFSLKIQVPALLQILQNLFYFSI
jgi:hypothetical protein